MTVDGAEIRRRVGELVDRWRAYDGTERAEAQTFLNELFACYGTNRKDVARFEDAQEGKFLDLIWDRVCLFEMKRPSESRRLAAHRDQAFEYWRNSADPARNLPAPRYLVLCSFRRFEIWEPGQFPNQPRTEFDLDDLPDRIDSLLFLAQRDPIFLNFQEAVTREAVDEITTLYNELRERRAADPDVLRDFVLQCVWCMFAEDLGQLEGHVFTRLLEDLIDQPRRSSADELGSLFNWLSTSRERPPGGLFARTPYVNGGLFRAPASVHLDRDELERLRAASAFQWKKVEPHIFGSLLEGALGPESRRALGAHYTHAADIMKVVGPTIVTPWRERIENLETVREAERLKGELLNFKILDPACGSGNFLYIAYREMRQLEARLREKDAELRRAAGLAEDQGLLDFFPLTNMHGIEIDSFATALARVTLWIGHKLAVDELGLTEATLPLEDLSGIRVGDALRMPWPDCDAIVSNPPFHGDRNLRGVLGDPYIDWLKDEFGCGIRDHCVYWFRKAQDHMKPGQRAGMVASNSISQNRGREAGLNYLVENGSVITNAVSSQPWPGEANVAVSIINWIKQPGPPVSTFVLDEAQVEGIDTALRPSNIAIADVPILAANRDIAFQGYLPGAKFDVDRETAEELLATDDADYSEVVFRYLDGRDITRTVDQAPTRYTIDFAQMPLEDAMGYPAALEILRKQAKQARENSRSYSRNPRWWQYLWPRPEFRAKAASLDRFIVGSATGKRVFFIWAPRVWRPSNSTNMFALRSDYSMAILCSSVHIQWARHRSSTLEDRIRYTPSSAFETFPWPPDPSAPQVEAVEQRGIKVIELRAGICAAKGIGLTTLYNQVDDGGWEELRRAHLDLDAAVLQAYGWGDLRPDDSREINARLLELNGAILDGEIEYEGPLGNGSPESREQSIGSDPSVRPTHRQ